VTVRGKGDRGSTGLIRVVQSLEEKKGNRGAAASSKEKIKVLGRKK